MGSLNEAARHHKNTLRQTLWEVACPTCGASARIRCSPGGIDSDRKYKLACAARWKLYDLTHPGILSHGTRTRQYNLGRTPSPKCKASQHTSCCGTRSLNHGVKAKCSCHCHTACEVDPDL
jgi:hypothetical protein